MNEIQSSLEIAALYTLTTQLRQGKISGISCPFSKVVHVGHSFGSIQSYSLAVLHPTVTDGLILTGFSQATSFTSDFLYGGNFVVANGVESFKSYPDGYLAAGDVSAVQNNFFSPGGFSPALLNLGYSSGQPVTVGELLTLSAQTAVSNPLTGPVLIITGGECLRNQHTKHKDTDVAPKVVIFHSVVEIAGSLETHLSQITSRCRVHTFRIRASSRLSSLQRPGMG